MFMNDFNNGFDNDGFEHGINDGVGDLLNWKLKQEAKKHQDPPKKVERHKDPPIVVHKNEKPKEVALKQEGNFPSELVYNKDAKYPIYNYKSETMDISEQLTNLTVFVSSRKSFKIKLSNIFKEPTRHTNLSEIKNYSKEPSLDYWSEQLNFSVWASTSGCGIGYDMLINTELPPMVVGFLRFHVIFTIRRILYELRAPLPNDKIFNLVKNRWDKGAFERLRNEFQIVSPDFRVRETINFDIDSLVVKNTGYGIWQRQNMGESPFKFVADESGAMYKENLVAWVDDEIKNQFNMFIPITSIGLTRAGLSRLNRSIEAYIYCVLGSQVNTRSSIIGDSGGAIQTQQEFGNLFESAIIEDDISKSILRYQMAIRESRVRLDFVIASGLWLMSSDLIINRESIIGYNNKLQKATDDMKLGINGLINTETKVVKHDDMGGSKTKLPHQADKDDKKHPSIKPKEPHKERKPDKPIVPKSKSHETMLIGVTIVAAAVVGYFMF